MIFFSFQDAPRCFSFRKKITEQKNEKREEKQKREITRGREIEITRERKRERFDEKVREERRMRVCVYPEGSEWRVLCDAAEALGYEGLEHEQHAADEA